MRLAPDLRNHPALDAVARIWLLGVAVVALAVWRDYGVTWDERWHMEYGDHILAWLQSLGADRSALSYRRDFYYGGGFDLLGAAVRRLSPLPAEASMHLLGALVGVLGLAGTWRLGRLLGGPAVGLAALVMLCVTPVWWGHMFNNPKDLPFAVGYVWGLAALVRWLREGPHPSKGTSVLLALALGLAASVRIGGVVLWCVFVATLIAAAVQRSHKRGGVAVLGRALRRAAARGFVVLAGAWSVMLAAWPWAQLDPLRRPVLALLKMSRFDLHERTMPFAGEMISTTEPRWDYLLHYFGLKLPLFLVVLVAAAAGLALWRLMDGRDRARGPATWGWPVVIAATVVPVVYAMAAGSVLYDGLRHFLFIVPPIVVVAAWGLLEIPRRFGASLPVLTIGVGVGMAALVVRQAWVMIELHPHQYVFFNRMAGGLAGASGRYSTDYYGNTYKEAFAGLFDALWAEQPHDYLNSTYVVTACMPREVGELYLPPNARFRRRGRTDAPPQFYLGYSRQGCADKHRNAPLFVEVKRLGATLAVVRDLRPLYPSARGGQRDH